MKLAYRTVPRDVPKMELGQTNVAIEAHPVYVNKAKYTMMMMNSKFVAV